MKAASPQRVDVSRTPSKMTVERSGSALLSSFSAAVRYTTTRRTVSGALRKRTTSSLRKPGAPGVLRDRTDSSTLVTFADPDDLAELMATVALVGGMKPKVEACIRAATGGVERTHIIDGRAPDSLLYEVFTGAGFGTMIVGRKEKATYLGVDLAD